MKLKEWVNGCELKEEAKGLVAQIDLRVEQENWEMLAKHIRRLIVIGSACLFDMAKLGRKEGGKE